MSATLVPTRPWLAALPVALFGVVMGSGGLGNAWVAAAAVFGVPLLIGHTLQALAALAFCVLLLAHGLRWIRHPEAVAADFAHPVRASFFPMVSVAALVLAIGLREPQPALAQLLWWAGTALHATLALTLLRRWVLQAQDEQVLTPAWFVPVVGNILVPVAGVPLGHAQLSGVFFSVGLVLWLVFFTIVLHRVLFVPAMSQRSMPTLFILLAPPSIGLLATLAFTGGVAHPLADLLWGLALALALLLASLARHLAHGEFFMSWWAMTFPAAGWAGACLAYHHSRPDTGTAVVAALALAVATAVVLWVAALTLRHAYSGALLHEDD